MKREQVNSSTVTSVGWQPFEGDPDNGTLEVEFASKGVYQYEGVPRETFESFMRSESKGHFFQVFVRPCFITVRLHLETCTSHSGNSCACDLRCWCHKTKETTRAQTAKETDKGPKKKAVKAKRTPI